MKPVVFIDRDGTINVEKNYVYRVSDFELIPESLEALQKLTQIGALIYVITNQAGIAKGHYSEEDFHVLNQYFLDLMESSSVKIEDILYCPHHPEGKVPQYTMACECRKPGTALIEKVFENHSSEKAAIFGDRNTDILAGKKVGIASYLVLTGYGSQEKNSTKADFIEENLYSAVNHFLGNL